MSIPWHIGIPVPARNEEELLPRCLESIFVACSFLPPQVTFDIVVAVDSSTDRTPIVARQMLREFGVGTVVYTEAGMVGSTRALATAALLERHQDLLDRLWLANTDADCCVPQNWLLDQLTHANDGIEAIAGVIDVDSFDQHSHEVEPRFRNTYLIYPDGSHPHVHGANFGVRADAYLQAGGWSDLATAEDHDLWNRLRQNGSRRISISRFPVLTSGRRLGRAPFGFAGALAAHNEATI